MSAWLALVPAVPLAAALFGGSRRARGALPWIAPWALLPALLVALRVPPGTVLALDWLLLGSQLGLDATGRVFLLFSALLWLLAALFARAWLASDPRRARFFGLFLAAAAGNFGVCLAQDAVSFYLFFALMTFAAWGLVLHRATPAARRAGTVYIVLAVLGETALLLALLLIVADGGLALATVPGTVAGSAWRDAIVALLLIGFGAKTGVLGLHVALPLAYGATPAPGAAVLASAMIKAGLLGWLRFLPLGFVVPGWSEAFTVLGLLAAFYGVVVGLLQREPKVILAYSSISQMGLITAGVGAGMAAPDAGGPALFALTLYALHHALVKGALFLGEGLQRAAQGVARAWALAGLALLALVLAGAPLTSGMLAKHYLKELATFAPWPLTPALTLATIGTTLLMARFLWQVWHSTADAPAAGTRDLWLPWLILVVAVLTLAWMTVPADGRAASAAQLADSAWPVALGALLAGLAARFLRRWRAALPPGDLLVPVVAIGADAGQRLRAVFRAAPPPAARITPARGGAVRRATARAADLETGLRSWRVFGGLSLLLAFGLVMLLASR